MFSQVRYNSLNIKGASAEYRVWFSISAQNYYLYHTHLVQQRRMFWKLLLEKVSTKYGFFMDGDSNIVLDNQH